MRKDKVEVRGGNDKGEKGGPRALSCQQSQNCLHSEKLVSTPKELFQAGMILQYVLLCVILFTIPVTVLEKLVIKNIQLTENKNNKVIYVNITNILK